MAIRPKSREAVTLELAEEVLRSSGQLQFIAHGSSMIPAIFPGDVLLARNQPMHSIRCGEVALWSRNGRFCAHRVRRKGNGGEPCEIVTRGDALDHDDLPIQADEFLGCVYAIVRRRKRIDLTRPQGFWSRSIALVVKRSELVAKSLLRYNSLARRPRETTPALATIDRRLTRCQ